MGFYAGTTGSVENQCNKMFFSLEDWQSQGILLVFFVICLPYQILESIRSRETSVGFSLSAQEINVFNDRSFS